MSLFITSLNSGSNGNCYYIGNEHEAILVDAGISCRETEVRMRRLGLSIQKVKAILISHEHADHIRGVTVLAHKYSIPVYITPLTYQHGGLAIADELVIPFSAHRPITIGSLCITAFTKLHDAAHPHSFIISSNEVTVGVFTDIGATCDNLIAHFKKCHAAFLEANYDDEMLDKGRYPYHLKRRIRGGNGHLSNAQALDVFIKYKPAHLTHLLLAHLSKDNNDPELAANLFRAHAGSVEIIVASRYQETDVYHIGLPAALPLTAEYGRLQYSLF